MTPLSPLIPVTASPLDPPDPATVYGWSGATPDVADYATEPWKGWILQVRAEMTREALVAEVGEALEEWNMAGGIVAGLDHYRDHAFLSTQAKHGRRHGRRDFRAEAIHAAVRFLGLPLAALAERFKVGVPTISRWASGARTPPYEFVEYVTDRALERFARAEVQLQALWLALCRDELTGETVERHLYQWWGEVCELVEAGGDIAALARPLTAKEVERLGKP